ncbi:hypothetical protein [Croceicoccus hydrothermalis]|uniref:hypothetical protein n=1 Tax=Croceicoccus hydrothermalis TaxID=2867964 RepID=UPI001EFB2642|nr:hypothetical protein [Croceicoccus hydrothermalis]
MLAELGWIEENFACGHAIVSDALRSFRKRGLRAFWIPCRSPLTLSTIRGLSPMAPLSSIRRSWQFPAPGFGDYMNRLKNRAMREKPRRGIV